MTLAQVLVQETPLLMLDEPIAALDPRYQHETLRIARALAAGGAAVLAVLHDLNLAAAYADRVALLAGDRLIGLGSPAQALTEDARPRRSTCRSWSAHTR